MTTDEINVIEAACEYDHALDIGTDADRASALKALRWAVSGLHAEAEGRWHAPE